jgi:hypothetical protein
MSYKKKQHWYITDRSKHHISQRNILGSLGLSRFQNIILPVPWLWHTANTPFVLVLEDV